METLLRAALLAWLRADPALAPLNSIAEEAPLKPSLPWFGIAASAGADWSTKELAGREVRIALELHCRGDDPASAAALAAAIEARVMTLPRTQTGFEIANIQFLRSRAEQRPNNVRSVLIEHSFRMLAS
jgi:hypothetical protein